MRFRYTVLFILLARVIFAQPVELYDIYKIPEYKYHQLTVEATDLFQFYRGNYLSIGNYSYRVRAHSGIGDCFEMQSKTMNASFMGNINYTYDFEKGKSLESYYNPVWDKMMYRWKETHEELSKFNFNLFGNVTKYLTNPRGFFIFAAPNLDYIQSTNSQGKNLAAGFNAGAGYGRVLGQRSVARAYLLLNELGVQYDNNKVYELAEVLDKEIVGYYKYNYRDSSDIVYYNEIARITGKPAELPRIQTILNSGVYKVTSRYNGWLVKFGVIGTYCNVDWHDPLMNNMDDFAADVNLAAEYAVPLGTNMQFTCGAAAIKNLQTYDYRGLQIDLSAAFSIDIKYFWSTTLSARISRAKPLKGDKMVNSEILLRSDVALFSSAVASLSVQYYNNEFYSGSNAGLGTLIQRNGNHPENITTNLGIKYFLM